MNDYSKVVKDAQMRINQIDNLLDSGLICRSNDFVPAVHYPPITQYPNLTVDNFFKTFNQSNEKLDIYIHFPFCEQHCTFCHYPVKIGAQKEEKKRYLKYLKKEINTYLKLRGISQIIPRSILVGGGTPTFLDHELLEEFLEYISEKVDMTQCSQFNYDVDPNTIVGEEGLKRLEIMKKFGVTRLTIGVQSLNDEILKHMNRGHNTKTALQSIDNAKKYGFDLNVEFIYGYPGQTYENWIDCVNQIVKLPVDEIQIYRLKVLAYGDRQGNIIHKKHEIVPFYETMTMKQIAINIFNQNGFYENLSRVFTKSKKNISHYAYNQCCNLYDQVGFGITAFSSYHDRFSLNTQSFKEYYDLLDQNILPMNRGYIRNKEEQLRWSIILPLKNMGIKKKKFYDINGIPLNSVFVNKMKLLKEYGLIDENEHTVYLTELGSFVADEVVQQFYTDEFIPFPVSSYSSGQLNPYQHNTSKDAFGDKDNKSKEESVFTILSNRKLFPEEITKTQIKDLLLASGDRQRELHKMARIKRNEIQGEVLRIRGVIEVSNICLSNCNYCAMRHSNHKIERYCMEKEQIKNVAKSIKEAGIKTVFLQSGTNPKNNDMIKALLPYIAKELQCEPLLCLGAKSFEDYHEFKKLGAESYILKFETSNEQLFERICHSSLAKQLYSISNIKKAGLKLGTGSIVGLPYQTIDSIADDILLSFSLQPNFVSVSPFIPSLGTPFANHPAGDLNITLNAIAILRLLLPNAFIPAVSALEYIQELAQVAGLNAGANVLTVNFTPRIEQKKYKIYTEDRFIVDVDHVKETAEKAGLKHSIGIHNRLY